MKNKRRWRSMYKAMEIVIHPLMEEHIISRPVEVYDWLEYKAKTAGTKLLHD